MDEHKFQKNRKYFTICIYVLMTFCVGILLLKAIWNWSATMRTVHRIIGMLSPFLIGIFIAYLMNPLVNLFNHKFFEKVLHIKKNSIRKGLSILISYIIVLGIITLCISVIVPEVYDSLKNIYDGAQGSYDKLIHFLEDMSVKYPDLDISYITTLVKDNSTNIINFIHGSLNTILPLLYNTSVSIISLAIDIIIAVIVSCYLLIDKDRLLFNCKRLIYALLKPCRAEKLLATFGDCNRIFGNFVIGKTIDSTIIGFLCFIFMNMLNLNYSMLISVIVGITNMIPYFGPFIGAIPGVIILLTVSWKHALIFGILIFILQQFDGLYLGPKILGESTGLRPVWIIFAITVGGWFAGPVGMFLGVPCIAVLAFLVNGFINRKLTEKNITLEQKSS